MLRALVSAGCRPLVLPLLLLLAPATPAAAQLVAEHSGDADPVSEGWSSVGAGTGVTTGAVVGDVGGFDAWSIDDASAAVGSNLSYELVPSAPQIAAAAARGWNLTVRLRIPTFPDTGPAGESIVVSYDDGATHYAMRFHADAAGRLSVVLTDDGPESSHDVLLDGYHVFHLRYTPSLGTATLWVDGVAEINNYDGLATLGSAAIRFGSIDDADTGHAHYSLVAFETPGLPPACRDGIDNDGDTLIDHPDDPGCTDPDSEFEDPACDDGIDNDGDTLVDLADPECNFTASHLLEEPARVLSCPQPDASIDLIGPPPTNIQVNSTCHFDAQLDQPIPDQADVYARLRGTPYGVWRELRHEHEITLGALAGEDNLSTDASPGLAFYLPEGAGPTEHVVVTTRAAQSGSTTTSVSEVAVTSNAVSILCPATAGTVQCAMDIPGGVVYTVEPRLQTQAHLGDGRAALAVAVSHVPRCRDGIDNDGDTFTDFAGGDPDCDSPDDLEEFDNRCSDGVNNDTDGLTDFPNDPGCSSRADPTETDPALPCDDGIDNDGDTLVDVDDPGCAGSPLAPQEDPVCSNGLDDDGDTLIDFPDDPGCAGPASNEEDPACSNGLDDDGDTLIDYPDDPGCASPVHKIEDPECQDGIDNDGDLLIDHPDDPDCASPSSVLEDGGIASCADGFDNDDDGQIDFPADNGCTSLADDSELVTSKAQRLCVTEMNWDGARLSREQHKVARLCIRFAQIQKPAKLGNPPQMQTAQACLTNDVNGKLAKRTTTLQDTEVAQCLAGPAPEFGYTDAATVEAAAKGEALALTSDLFGTDLDVALVTYAADTTAARCQQHVQRRTASLYHVLWRTIRTEKKASLAGTSGPPSENAAALAADLQAALLADTKGRIARETQRLADQVTSKCSGVAIPFSTLFPGACSASATPAALSTCATERARCRACLALEAFDALTMACDDLDDGVANGSCF